MGREKIDEILDILNDEEILSDTEQYEKTIRNLISKVEESLKVEDEDYFYGNLDYSLYPFISNEKKKNDVLKEITDIYYKIDIIKSLQSDEKKAELLDEMVDLIDEFLVTEIIESMKSDDKKVEALDKLESDSFKVEIIQSLQSDDKKVEALDKLESDFYKTLIIRTLQSDDKKIEALDKFSDDLRRAEVIISLPEEKRIECLDKLHEDYFISKVIISLPEEKRIECLDKLTSYSCKKNVIMSLSQEKRIEYIAMITDNRLKVDIITELPEEERISYLDKLTDESSKVEIIQTFFDDNNKIEGLSYLNNDSDKASIIVTLKDYDKIMEELGKLKDNSAKETVLLALQNVNEKLENLSDLNNIFSNQNIKYSEIGIDNNITIGIEIESEGILSPIELMQLMSVLEKRTDKIKGWKYEYDGSLEHGSEVVSPILKDSIEDVEKIYMMCSILQECEQKTSERCGGHVHIGADYLKSMEEYKELLEIWGNAEKVYFLISNQAGELPRCGTKDFSSPISGKIEDGNLSESKDDEFIENIKKVQLNRYSALNFMNVNSRKNTIEFRLSNGTIDPNVWIENIRLYGRTVQMAHEIAQINMKLQEGKQITEEEKRKLQMKAILKKDVDLDEKKDALLELLFDEEERKVYEERYQSNKTLEEKEHRLEKMKFGQVDFEENYQIADKSKNTIEELNERDSERKPTPTQEMNLDDEGR